MIFQFYCDESYDGNPKGNRTISKGDTPFEPASYIVGGFFADQATWDKIDVAWTNKNRRVGVERYHAAHLNGATYEYDGWSKNRRLQYSRSMLRALKRQKGKLHGVSCGLYVDEYRRIINAEGQKKLGHPYLVCFKSVIAAIAKEMDRTFRPEDRFSVVLDQNKWGKDAVDLFYWMKDHPGFSYASRLEDCESGDSAKCTGLQVADFVAYETFKLMHGKRNGATEQMGVVLRHTIRKRDDSRASIWHENFSFRPVAGMKKSARTMLSATRRIDSNQAPSGCTAASAQHSPADDIKLSML